MRTNYSRTAGTNGTTLTLYMHSIAGSKTDLIAELGCTVLCILTDIVLTWEESRPTNGDVCVRLAAARLFMSTLGPRSRKRPVSLSVMLASPGLRACHEAMALVHRLLGGVQRKAETKNQVRRTS